VTRPHIAVNASVLGDRPSGLGRYVLSLIEALQNADAQVSAHQSSSALIRRDRGLTRHAARLLWCQTALRGRVRRSGADVLLNPLPEGLLFPVVPQVTVLHDLIPLTFPVLYPRQQWYFRRLVPAILRRSRMVITLSEATRRQAVETYRVPLERTRVIPAGYDRRVFRAEGPARGDGGLPYVLFVGNILPHKNVVRLVEAFTLVGRRTPARLIIAGKGWPSEVALVQARAAEAGVPIELRSYVAHDELPALYRGARVVVVPSLAEGFGLTALEAMATGTPVVASDRTSLPEVVGDGGLLVDPTDVAAIADAVTAVLTDDALHKDLSARAIARAATFSWERTAREVLDVLTAVATA
jgi:glycosyltransferase involved in cell wall biosynthesis